MDTLDTKKPCVVETPQGFSVSYKDHFLYSKYSPSKTILNTINQLEILPGTIILCFSPLLGYGLNELKAKLPDNCLIVLCEANSDLYSFTKEKLSDSSFFPLPEDLSTLPVTLYNQNTKGTYKRVIRIDFSAGIQFHKQFYDELYNACVNSIMTFWKNRITLTKFGRRYSRNFLSNLGILGQTTPITQFFNKIERPILVFGAGQSVDLFFTKNHINPSDFYILCADTALQPLLQRQITPDGIFIEEAQSIISKAFIGAPENIHIFAGLSSLPQIERQHPLKNISFFTTEYTTATFIEQLKKEDFLPPVNPPYGSVGLTTVHYALLFRKDDSIPVYVTGLDFSYSAGLTHTKNTLAHITRLTQSSRLLPVQNYGAAFNSSTIKFLDKRNNVFFTTPTLQTYAATFNNVFINTKNLFDAGECGIPLTILRGTPLADSKVLHEKIEIKEYSELQKEHVKNYIKAEKESLLKLRSLLTGQIILPENELKEEIIKLATSKEYLYLHFADGYDFTYSQSFLNRIRIEIDYFLKWL